jgi:hypothetical protein
MVEIGTLEFDNLNSEGSSAAGFDVSVDNPTREMEHCCGVVFKEG